MSGIRLYVAAGVGLVFVLTIAWALRLEHLRGNWQERFDALNGQANGVLEAARVAADNPGLAWGSVAGQVYALGDDKRALTAAVAAQNVAIDDMAREAVRLRAGATELKRIADLAQAQRQTALDRLTDMAIMPGARDDCEQLLRQAEEALDLVRAAALETGS